MIHSRRTGFSLVEILVTLALLALLATFTIPKVLGVFTGNAGDESRRNVQAAASMIQGAYMRYRQENNPNSETRFGHITPYINYVKVLTSGNVDYHKPVGGVMPCWTGAPCLVMQNGAMIRYWHGNGSTTGNEFGGTTGNRYLHFYIDPDGTPKNLAANSDDPSVSIHTFLYFDGKIKDGPTCLAGDLTTNNDVDINWCPGTIGQRPTWFDWDSN